MSVITQLLDLGVVITQDQDGWYWQHNLGTNATTQCNQRYTDYMDAIDDAVSTFNIVPQSFTVEPTTIVRDTWHLDDLGVDDEYEQSSGHDDF